VQALNTAAAGMFAAADRLSASAQRTAAWGLEETKTEEKTDLAKEAVEQISAKTDFKANAAVAKTADEMMGALLDIKA
jgi:flagellar hook protein FlgE